MKVSIGGFLSTRGIIKNCTKKEFNSFIELVKLEGNDIKFIKHENNNNRST